MKYIVKGLMVNASRGENYLLEYEIRGKLLHKGDIVNLIYQKIDDRVSYDIVIDGKIVGFIFEKCVNKYLEPARDKILKELLK